MYSCEYCDGQVRDTLMKQEVFMHPQGPVILEDVTIGICDRCGHRYYGLHLVEAADALATGKKQPERTQAVPVAHA